MPLPIPDRTPPRPPSGFTISQKPTFDELVAVVKHQSDYIRSLVLYQQQMWVQMRDAINWLILQQPVRNLVPDSDIKQGSTFWTVAGGGWAITDGVGVGGGRGFSLSASLPGTAETVSSAIVVLPETFYVLSGWLDLTDLTSGSVSWVAYDPAGAVDLAVAAGVAGQSIRTQLGFTVPAGVSSIEIRLRSTNAVVAGSIVASQPQLELPGQGQVGATMPEASLYRTNVGDN